MIVEKPWLKHYPADIPQTLNYPDQPLFALLDEAAQKHGKATALIYFGQKISYEQLQEMTERFAAALVQIGAQPGEKISLMLPNIPQFVIAFYGALKAGLTVVQTNPLYTEDELQVVLGDSQAETLITLDRFYEKVLHLKGKANLKRIIVTGVQEFFPGLLRLGYLLKERPKRIRPSPPSVYLFSDLIRHAPAHPPKILVRPSEIALFQYTGGTTGIPKGAMLTHKNLVANTLQARAWFPRVQPAQETCLCVLPLFHVYAMTVALNLSMAIAAALILVPRFQIDELLKTIDRQRPTLLPGAPTLYAAIANHSRVREYNVSSIKACISGSAPLPLEVKRRFEELTGASLVEGYGLSEASPVTHCNPLYGRQVAGSIGIPFPDTNAKIVDPASGRELPVGEIGELVIQGPQVMAGYWNRPEETAMALRGGWLHTGDLARMDEDGYFYIVDRLKEMIICSGLKVYPREVEEVLYKHPKVLEAAVVGAPDAYRGETVKALIVPRPGTSPTADEIKAFCAEHLAKYKVPTIVEFRESLPKSIIGKVLKRELR
ncbi:MAG: long-chain fatty acid--CoA ligase [Candidatus Bipolaricaulota bacterium]|nr:long-chain fatty acid--CoA ligase [Candidatus Bipolaricaulota bacterium]